jgi:hypothetical protein
MSAAWIPIAGLFTAACRLIIPSLWTASAARASYYNFILIFARNSEVVKKIKMNRNLKVFTANVIVRGSSTK